MTKRDEIPDQVWYDDLLLLHWVSCQVRYDILSFVDIFVKYAIIILSLFSKTMILDGKWNRCSGLGGSTRRLHQRGRNSVDTHSKDFAWYSA